MDNYLPFVTIDVWTIIFTWCNLIILYLLMKKFFFGRVSDILQKRDNEVRENINSAQRSLYSAKQKENEYTLKLKGADLEAEKILEQAKKDATAQSNKIILNAKEHSQSIIQKAEKEIANERHESLITLKGDITNISISIAEKILKRDISTSDHRRIINEVIEELDDTP